MDRGTRIARSLGRGHDKLRRIFLKEQCLRLLTGDKEDFSPPATYDSHWFLDKHVYTELPSGKRFMKLYVDDVEGCRMALLKAATAVQIGDAIYKFHAKDSFVGAIPSYEFKIYPLGDRI